MAGIKNYKIDLGHVGIVRELILEKGFGNSIAELVLNNLQNCIFFLRDLSLFFF